MMELIIDTRTLPEPIMRKIQTKKAKVREINGDIVISPIREENAECPFLGMFADGKISSEKYMARKQAERELER